MRTEEDLRRTFDHLADTAPDPSRILTTAEPQPVRRSRTPLLIGAALATTAAVVAVPLAVNHHQQQTASPAAHQTIRPSNDAWRVRLSVPVQAPLAYDNRTFGPSSQRIIVADWTSEMTCVLDSYAKGAFDAGRIPPGSPRVKINDNLGYIALLVDPFSPAVKSKQVVWEAAPDTWVSSWCLVGRRVDTTKAVSIARTARLSEQRLPAPYRIRYLPAELQVTGLSSTPHDNDLDFATSLGARQQPLPDQIGPAEISYLTGDAVKATKLPSNAERIAINGRTGYLGTDVGGGATVLAIKGNGFQVRIILAGAVPNEREELIKIAKGLDLAPSATDTSTWFDAATAIP
jgi:hypothetical protein